MHLIRWNTFYTNIKVTKYHKACRTVCAVIDSYVIAQSALLSFFSTGISMYITCWHCLQYSSKRIFIYQYGLAQCCDICIINTLKILQSCTMPSIFYLRVCKSDITSGCCKYKVGWICNTTCMIMWYHLILCHEFSLLDTESFREIFMYIC